MNSVPQRRALDITKLPGSPYRWGHTAIRVSDRTTGLTSA